MIKRSLVRPQRCVVAALRYQGMVLALVLLVIVGFITAAKADPDLTFATSKSGWIVWIADARGLFKENGVDVKIELVTSGVAAAKGLIAGDYDLATMSEYAFVAKSFDHADLKLVGTVAAISNIRLIGRKDQGVVDGTNLGGKRIGLLEGAISQFFLGKLLDINGIDPNSVTVVNYRPPALPKALKAGDVDAIVSWEPYASLSRDAIGEQASELNVQGGQSYYFAIAAKDKTLSEKSEKVKAVISALIEAADWAALNPDDAKQLLHQKLDLEMQDIENFWPDNVMDVTLAQDMIFLMSEQAIWRSERGLSNGEIPDFFNRINFDALESIDPSRVSVIK